MRIGVKEQMNQRSDLAMIQPRPVTVLYLILVGFIFMAGCDNARQENESSSEPISRVIASNYAVWYFASALGGEEIEVVFQAPDSVDPSYWQPREKDVREMQQAKLVALNGAGYEHWLPTVTLVERRVVETAQPFRSQWIEIETEVTHTHGPEGEHSHTGWADHTWLDPALAIQQVDALAEAMVNAFPEHETRIKSRQQALKDSLVQWGNEIEDKLGAYQGRPLLTSHPIYQYFGRCIGMPLTSVVWEPRETPDAAEREEFESLLQQTPASVMLWEAKPTQPTLDYLASQGVKAVVFDPCSQRPASGNYFDQMRANLERLVEALESEVP